MSGILGQAEMFCFGLWPISEVATLLIEVRLVGHSGLDLLTLSSSHFDPSAALGSTQETARSHLIGGMVRPGGDVLSLRAYVQPPQHVSDELLHVV
jgi:hypothetical protein